MASRPVLLCAIDFSEASRSALRYATSIADHFGGRLVLLTVDHPLRVDPLRVDGIATHGDRQRLLAEAAEELRLFAEKTWPPRVPSGAELDVRVAVGQPAAEILRAVEDTNAELIVMSSRGSSGFRKLFFGSTTERVLRDTKVPVLVTPTAPGSPTTFEEIGQRARRVVAPVDLTPASRQQVVIAAGIAAALSAPLILMHVLEPPRTVSAWRSKLPGLGFAQRAEVEDALEKLTAEARGVQAETLVVYGEPSEEIAKVADVRGATLVVMGLHSSTSDGPRIGSVTYRVLCLSHGLVLAWPPEWKPRAHDAKASQSNVSMHKAVSVDMVLAPRRR